MTPPPECMVFDAVVALQRLVEAAHVAVHARHRIGVESRGADALVFAYPRVHLRRQRKREAGRHLLDDLRHGHLIDGIGVGVDEADRDRLHAFVEQALDDRARLLGIDRTQHGAVGRDPLVDR